MKNSTIIQGISKSLSPQYAWWVLITTILALQAWFTLTMTHNISFDFAEQLLLSQQGWSLGYSDQPPLYTWLFLFVNQTFGLNSMLTLVILTYTLMGLMFMFFYLTAKRILYHPVIAAMATTSYFIIGIFYERIPMHMTNSILLVCVIAATLYVLIRLQEKPNVIWYSWLGLCFGIGILSKWNYALIVFSILLTWLILPRFRTYLFNKYLWITLVITLAIISAPLLWIFLQPYSLIRFNDHLRSHISENYLLTVASSLLRFMDKLIQFVLPFAIITLISFAKPLYQSMKNRHYIIHRMHDGAILIGMIMAMATLVILLSILVGLTTWIELYWLITPFSLLPLFMFAWIEACQPKKIHWKIYTYALLIALCTIISLATMRHFVGGDLCNACTKLRDYKQAIPTIANLGFKDGMIITDCIIIGGNLKLHLPNSIVLVPTNAKTSHLTKASPKSQNILVLWNNDNIQAIEDTLAGIGFTNVSPATDTGYLSFPIYGSKKDRKILYYYAYYEVYT